MKCWCDNAAMCQSATSICVMSPCVALAVCRVRGPGRHINCVFNLQSQDSIMITIGKLFLASADNEPSRGCADAHCPEKEPIRSFSLLKVSSRDTKIIIRLNLVKIRFSQNAFFIFFFTGGAFIVVKYNIKLVLEF